MWFYLRMTHRSRVDQSLVQVSSSVVHKRLDLTNGPGQSALISARFDSTGHKQAFLRYYVHRYRRN